MIRLLLVDDDVTQLRGLSRTFSALHSDLRVLTAVGGEKALEHLSENQVDVVLTDLEMPGTNGVDLLGWLFSNMPHVPVFAMTGHLGAEGARRLETFGALDCFIKPLDPSGVVDRLRRAATNDVRGHVRNFSLSSFLQLVGMERKTCTLFVEQDGVLGRLYLRDGELLDAECNGLRGEEAALVIAGWGSPTISISSHCGVKTRAIQSSLGYIILEAMRRRDEADGIVEIAPASLRLRFSEYDTLARKSERPSSPPRSAPLPPGTLPVPTLDVFEGALAVAIADDSGRVVASAQSGPIDLAAWCLLGSALLRHQQKMGLHFGGAQIVEEMVINQTGSCVLMRPLSMEGADGYFALLVFDPETSSLMRRKLELERFARTPVARTDH